jgi:hypothetical protein
MNNANNGLESLNRPLTMYERDLIKWLIEHGEPGNVRLIAQIDVLTVVSKCTCGCPTIYFAFEGEPVPRKGEHIVSDYLASSGGSELGVMLFQTEGHLSSLEVYSQTGIEVTFGLPPIETLYSYSDLPQRHAGESDSKPI